MHTHTLHKHDHSSPCSMQFCGVLKPWEELHFHSQQEEEVYGAFNRHTNDVIWAKKKDFELPLAFQAAEVDPKNTCRDTKMESDLEDEDYKFFLENIRNDGISCAFQLKKEENGGETFVRYEEAEDRQGIYQNYKENLPCRNCKLDARRNSKKEGSKKRTKLTGCVDGNAVCVNSKAMMTKVSGISPTKTIGKRKAKLQCNDNQITKAEQATLQHNAGKIVMAEGTNLQNISGQIVKAEPFLETSSSYEADVEIFESRIEISRIQSADFRKNLEITLKKPFNTQDLHDMWNDVSCRKPIVQLRQTRHREFFVETNQEGSSYLDYHPDFAEKLASASSPEEKLSLLRGFFFWLKNSSWADAYKPWASCYRRQSGENINDEDECFEVDRPDREMIAIVLPVEDPLLLPGVRVKEERPDI